MAGARLALTPTVHQMISVGPIALFADTQGEISYPIVRDGPGHVVAKYGLTGVPETFFVGRSGKLVGPHVEGQVTKRQLAEGIHAAMRS